MPKRLDPLPMRTFGPTLPVVVHEVSHDVEVEWVPVTPEEWNAKAEWTGDRTAVHWGEMLLDCWWLARDEDIHPDAPAA